MNERQGLTPMGELIALRQELRVAMYLGHSYKQGDIVLIKTHDAIHGDVTVPAIVRCWDPQTRTYEVNVVMNDGSHMHDQESCLWWNVIPGEIHALLGHVSIEKPQELTYGKITFEVHRFKGG